MTTYLQTITIDFPNTPVSFLGMEKAPICPPNYKPGSKNGFIVMKTEDKSIITWWKRGEIIKISDDGQVKTWFPKPTLADSIRACLYTKTKGCYFEFGPDSSVISRMDDGYYYYWSPPISGKPEIGTQVLGYDYDENSPEVEEPPNANCYECYSASR